MVPAFVILYALFRFLNSNTHRLHLNEEKEKDAKTAQNKRNIGNTLKYSLILLLTGVILYVIGEFLGNTLESLCNIFSVPEFVVGILLGFITSIPELITFFESQKHYNKTKDDMLGVVEATNNLLTSNIVNLFIIQTIGILMMNI